MADNQEPDHGFSDGSHSEIDGSAGLVNDPHAREKQEHFPAEVDTKAQGDMVSVQTTMPDQSVLSSNQEVIPAQTFDTLVYHSSPTFDGLQQSQVLSLSVPPNEQRIAVFPYECSSRSNSVSPLKLPSRTYTPVGLNAPLRAPNDNYLAVPQQSIYPPESLHPRTETLEHRTFRKNLGGKFNLIMVDMEEQDDKSLLLRFFEQIEGWATNYTIDIMALGVEEAYDLAEHPALTGILRWPAQSKILLTEQASLDAIVASVILRHICMHAWDEHFLQVSGHPQAAMCEELSSRWSRLPEDAYEAKHGLLLSQNQIYTSIKNDHGHQNWRHACASHFSIELLTSLSGLLRTHMAARGFSARNEALLELYDKGYKIGFRLHTAPSQWSFQWPLVDADLEPTATNDSRQLDADVLSMTTVILNHPKAHSIRFAVTPMTTVTGFDDGEEKGTLVHDAVVHNALVFLTRTD